jgi:hypothetical protein
MDIFHTLSQIDHTSQKGPKMTTNRSRKDQALSLSQNVHILSQRDHTSQKVHTLPQRDHTSQKANALSQRYHVLTLCDV